MANIEFDTPNMNLPTRSEKPLSNLTGVLVRSGIVKNQTQATIVFIIVITLSLAYIGYYFFSSNGPDIVPVKELQKIDQSQFITEPQ